MSVESAPRVLILWSNYYEALAEQQRDICQAQLSDYDFDAQFETVEAGTYELPAVIQHFRQHQPYDAYLPLSLLLQGSTDHYAFIWEHVKDCFKDFAMDGVLLGNGIISAPTKEILRERVANGERTHEALEAIDYLTRLKRRLL